MTVAYAESVRAALRTTTGTQDFTQAGFGTPVGCIVILTQATADGTVASGMRMSKGFADATRTRMVAQSSQDNVDTSVAKKAASQDYVAALIKFDGSGFDVLVEFDSFITDGVRLNVSTTDGVAYLCQVVMLGGADSDSYAGHFEMGAVTAGDTLDVTDPPFPPDFIFFLGANTPFETGTPTIVAGNMIDIGFGVGSLEQARYTYAMGDGAAISIPSGQSPAALTNNIYLRVTPSGASPTTGESVRLSAILSPGFQVSAVTTATMPQVAYLAVDFGGATADIAVVTSPTSVGDVTVSMTNPGYAFLIEMGVTVTGIQSGPFGAVIGTGFASQNTTHCWGLHEEDNVSTMNNGVFSEDKTLRTLAHGGGSDLVVADGSFSTTQFTLSYTTVEASGHRAYVLLVPRATFSGTGSPSFPLATGTGAGLLVFEATGTPVFPLPTGTGAGLLTFTGTGAGTFATPTGTGAGLLVFEATGAAVFPLPTGTGAGLLEFTGTSAGSFPLPTGTGAGILEFTSTGAGAFPLPQAAGIGLLVFEGSGAGLFPLPTGTGAALLVFTGTGDGVFPLPSGDGTGTVFGIHVGTGDGVFPLTTGTGAGLLIFVGTGDGVFPLPLGSGVGGSGELEGCTAQLLGSSDQEAVLVGSSDQVAALVGSYDRRSDLRGANC